MDNIDHPKKSPTFNKDELTIFFKMKLIDIYQSIHQQLQLDLFHHMNNIQTLWKLLSI